MFKIKHVLFASFTACLAVSCSQNEQPVVSPSEVNTLNSTARLSSEARYDPVIEGLAKVLAQALKNSQVRKFVKNEALKKFDGDYDILLQNVAHSPIGSKTVKDILNSNGASSFNYDDAIRKIPLLNIAVPVNLHKWQEDSFAPLVVAFPDIQDESKLTTVKAYNSEGKEVWLDTQDLPDEPIIVISVNERTQVATNGKIVRRKDLLNVSRDANGRLAAVPPTDQTVNKALSGCTYADGQYLYAKWFFSDDVERWESELKGLPEITMRVYAPSSATNFSSLGEIRRVDEMEEPATRKNGTFRWNKDKWYGTLTNAPNGTSIVNWVNSQFSKTLLFHFAEIDGGDSKVMVTAGGSFKLVKDGNEASVNLSVTFDIANNDDNIGQLIVDQCQTPPQPPHELSNGQPYYDVNGTAFGVVFGN